MGNRVPYEDDLQEFSDREAWEDAQAEMRDGEDFEDEDFEDGEDYFDAEAEAERRAEYAMECALGFGE